MTRDKYLVLLLVFDSNLFSPIFRPSEVAPDDDVGRGLKSPFRLTVGAARTVSWAQSLHGLLEISFFVVKVDFEVPTVAVVVAERLEIVVVFEDIWSRNESELYEGQIVSPV